MIGPRCISRATGILFPLASVIGFWVWTGHAADYPGAAYPDSRPGAAQLRIDGSQLSAGTKAVQFDWVLDSGGLRPKSIRDAQSRQTLPIEGELFSILFTNGTVCRASECRPEAAPRLGKLKPQPGASRLSARLPGRNLELPLVSADGSLRIVWRAIAVDQANYVRQEIEVRPLRENCVLKEIVWFDQGIRGARMAGTVDGSPALAGNFFFGAEDPHSVSAPAGDRAVSFRVPRSAPLRPGEVLVQSFVAGVAPAGQMRRAFLYYLERERAHPYRPFLHYNSWYDIAWQPFALNETNCTEAIRIFGERFIRKYNVVMDSMVFDDGWDNPKSLWEFHTGFPQGFAPLAGTCREYSTRLGVWLSPFGGYGEPREQRLKHGHEQGYEINATGFSLAGPKYYAAFKNACVKMIRQYGVNHFKFDGIAAGMYANGGADYVLDTEAMRRLMLELRREHPDLYINLTTGSWPSPFWLRFGDSLWRQGGDMGLAGKGAKQQQWLTYRDQEVYRNIVGKGPLFPLNSLMSQGVAYSRQGTAGEPTFNSAGFKDDVRAFFGSGTGLQELYIQPGKLTEEDWRVLAEAAQWSRANAGVLVDTHWIGGDPSKLQVYGYASWTPRKVTVMLRNPDDRPQVFHLEPGRVFELPKGARTKFNLKSPWGEDKARPVWVFEAGKDSAVTLQPFEVVVLEGIPTR